MKIIQSPRALTLNETLIKIYIPINTRYIDNILKIKNIKPIR